METLIEPSDLVEIADKTQVHEPISTKFNFYLLWIC